MFPLTKKPAEELRADRQPEFTQIDAWQKRATREKITGGSSHLIYIYK